MIIQHIVTYIWKMYVKFNVLIYLFIYYYNKNILLVKNIYL